MRNKKRSKYLFLLILLLGISIGYAALATTLKINGSAGITKNNWSVYWSNPAVTQGSVSTTLPTIGNDTNGAVDTVATWSTTLSLPGDFYEFTIDATNNGTIDAMITGISDTVTPTLPSYIKYEVTYDDGKPILEKHLLPKKNGNTPTTQKYKVRVEFLDTITPAQMDAIPQAGLTYTFEYGVTYGQADSSAVTKPGALEDDTWATIAANVQNSPLSYSVGETKTIEMDLDNDTTPETYTLRVVNNTTPAECSTTGFSQTGCGFVLEFTDIIEQRRINAYVGGPTQEDGNGNKGGWEYSDMRAYLNGYTYAYQDINYSSNSLYSKLPSALQDAIISTSVVSGRGGSYSGTSSVNDKLFILTSKELYGEAIGNGEQDNDVTRQLDYYTKIGASKDNKEVLIKNYNNTAASYWTRSAAANSTVTWNAVNHQAGWPSDMVTNQNGLVPAFRIG